MTAIPSGVALCQHCLIGMFWEHLEPHRRRTAAVMAEPSGQSKRHPAAAGATSGSSVCSPSFGLGSRQGQRRAAYRNWRFTPSQERRREKKTQKIRVTIKLYECVTNLRRDFFFFFFLSCNPKPPGAETEEGVKLRQVRRYFPICPVSHSVHVYVCIYKEGGGGRTYSNIITLHE